MSHDASSAGGRFEHAGLIFELDDGDTAVQVEDAVELAVQDLDARLAASGRVPDLSGAPIASWVLSRLVHLAGSQLGFHPGLVEHVEGGVFVIDWVVRERGAAVAKVQLQAGAIGVGLLGVVPARLAEGLADKLVSALVLDPQALEPVEVCVVDSKEESNTFRYGYDGRSFLR